MLHRLEKGLDCHTHTHLRYRLQCCRILNALMVDMSHTAILITFTSYTLVPAVAKPPSEAARSENLWCVTSALALANKKWEP